MTVNIREMQDAVLEAQADITEAVREIVREFVADSVKRQALQMWAQMPDDMKERFKTERPDEYRALMEGMKR